MNNLQGKRAILYRRVSTTDQRIHGNSLNAQRESLRSFCDSKGINIVQEFQEDHSAKNFKDRSVFQEMLRFAESKKTGIDYLLTTRFDRFSRGGSDAQHMRKVFNNWGIEVNFIEQWMDWDDPFQHISNTIQMVLPESENLIKAHRTKTGMRQALKEGRYVGRQPIGYLPGTDEVDKPLMKVDLETAPLITQLFQRYATGRFSQGQLLKDPKFQSLKLSKSNLSRILSNELYVGIVIVPRFNNEEEFRVSGLHEALISRTVFQKVQEIRNSRKKTAPKVQKFNPELPLRGHLKCPKCKRNLTGSGSKAKNGSKHYYYHCNVRLGCDYRGKRKDHHQAFEKLLESIRPEEGVVRLFEAILRDEFNGRYNSVASELNSAEKRLRSLQNKKEKLTEKLIEGIVSDSDYQNHTLSLNNQIQVVQSQIERLNDADSGIEDFIPFGISLLTNLGSFFEAVSAETKHQLLSSILAEKIELKGEKYRTPVFKEGFELIYQSVNQLQAEKPKTGDRIAAISRLVPGAGLEPARPFGSTDFKSVVSTNSTIQA